MDTDKAEMLNAFLVSVFSIGDRPRGSQCPVLEDHDCVNDQLTVDPEIVWDLLLQLDPYKSMRPDGIHLKVLKKLPDVITKPLSVLEQSQESREVPADWKLGKVVTVFKKGKTLETAGLSVSLQCPVKQ